MLGSVRSVALAAAMALLAAVGCDDGGVGADADVDVDADADVDAGSDGGGDAEPDADGGRDADQAGDADAEAATDAEAAADADADAAADAVVDAGLPPWPTGRTIAPEEVHERWLARDPELLLLNVVDEEFHDLGHIEGSLVIPWDLLAGRLDEVDASRHVVVYCRLGVRSEAAYTTLTTSGYAHVWIMEGGLTAWIAAGYPTVP